MGESRVAALHARVADWLSRGIRDHAWALEMIGVRPTKLGILDHEDLAKNRAKLHLLMQEGLSKARDTANPGKAAHGWTLLRDPSLAFCLDDPYRFQDADHRYAAQRRRTIIEEAVAGAGAS